MVVGVWSGRTSSSSRMNDLNSKNEGKACKADEEKTLIDLCCLKLDSFPISTYRTFKNIQHIYLEGNKVRKLGDEFFPTFPKLKWLDIRNNELDEIPKTVANHPSLQVLLLEGNNLLKELPPELGSIQTLRGIQLAKNQLFYPPKEVVAKGSGEVIHFLQKEWQNKQKNSKISSSLQSCQTINNKRSTESSDQKKMKSSNLRRKNRRTSTQRLMSRKPSFTLKDCVKVTKLVRPKPKTAVTIFKDWTSVINKSDEVSSVKITENQMDSCPKNVSLTPKFFNTRSSQQESSGLLVKLNLLKDTWLRRIRDVLAEQESELQRTRNKDSLRKWQTAAKEQQVKKWAEYVQGQVKKLDVPFGTDEEYSKILSRSDIEKGEKSLKFRIQTAKSTELTGERIASKMNELLNVLQHLRNARSNQKMSPRSEQENFSSEIKKITELQRTLSTLKAINFTHSVKPQ